MSRTKTSNDGALNLWVLLVCALIASLYAGWTLARPGSWVAHWAWWTVIMTVMGARWHNRRGLQALAVVPVTRPAAFDGQPRHLVVAVHNPRSLPFGELQWVTDPLDPAAPFFAVEPRTERQVTAPLPSRRRGVTATETLCLRSAFPLGLWRRQRAVTVAGPFVVYPALEPEAPAWPETSQTPQGIARAGEDIVALRAYQTGDALSGIDWKRSARHGDFLVRQFEDPARQRRGFAYDQVAHLPVEQALSRLASWLVRAEREGLAYALVLPDTTCPTDQGPAHLHLCLTALAAFRDPAA